MADSLVRYLGSAHATKLRWQIVIGQRNHDIGEEIVRLAYQRHVDLIVMRPRRSRDLAKIGSITEQVSRTALCPVIVTRWQRRSGPAESNGQAGLRRILVAHDFSSASELALSYALSIGQKLNAEMHLMHVLPEPEGKQRKVACGSSGIETAFYGAIKRIQDSLPQQTYCFRKVQHVVRWGKPYGEVLAYARLVPAELPLERWVKTPKKSH